MKQDTIRVGAVIAAGGMAQRMQGVDKQLLELNGVPVLVRSIQALAQVRSIQELVVVARQEQFARLQSWKEQYHLPDFVLTTGGATRQQSVQAGIAKLSEQVEYFVIHDGARPFAQPQMIEQCIQAAVEYGAATAAVRVKDTIKQAVPGDGKTVPKACLVRSTPDRSTLYAVQTPQCFDRTQYLAALQELDAEKARLVTDDCSLFELTGRSVQLTQGDYANLKITTREDLPRPVQKEETRMRIGHGYDVHRLVEGRKLILGGVEIPFEKGLLGHSDADVLAHAVMDAVLGAAALAEGISRFRAAKVVFWVFTLVFATSVRCSPLTTVALPDFLIGRTVLSASPQESARDFAAIDDLVYDRKDLPQIKAIASWIDTHCADGEIAYMIPHDTLYCPDHFKNCQLPATPINNKLAFGFSVPGTHYFPMQFFEAKYVLTADPFPLTHVNDPENEMSHKLNDMFLAVRDEYFALEETFDMGNGTTFTIWKRTAAPTREEVEYYLSAFAEEDAQYPEMFSQVAEAWLASHGL